MEETVQSERQTRCRPRILLRVVSKVLPVLVLTCALSACKEHQLSGSDLQALKRGTLQAQEGKISDQQKFRIGTIQAHTRADYDREVNRILSDSREKQTKS